MDYVTQWSAAKIAAEVSGGRIQAQAVVSAFLDRIRALDGDIRAFVTVLEREALEQARAVDDAVSRGRKPGRLAGVPVALKDNILVDGVETTCSSKILRGYKAGYDATVVERLRAEGAVFIGKTNLDEFAMGSSTENSGFFPTRNPWDLERVPGGSSGGSAAAVASRMAALAFGSDTGGSIRQPASFCGVVGMKPTYGLVSRYGLVAFASSLDQIGPLARSVEDAALALSVISGHDPRDSTSAPGAAKDYHGALTGGVKGLRIGIPSEYFIDGMDPEVEGQVRGSIEVLRGLGAELREVSLPHTRYAVSTYYLVAPAEASANLARFDGIRYGHSVWRDAKSPAAGQAPMSLLEVYERSRGEGFGAEVKRRIMLGTYALSSGYYDAYYGKAQRVRTLIQRDFQDAFKSVDVIAAPVCPSAAFKLGEKAADPLQMYLSDIFTIPCNLAGIPGLAVPCGKTAAGLPVGLQLLGRPFEEPVMLRTAAALEAARPFPALPEVHA